MGLVTYFLSYFGVGLDEGFGDWKNSIFDFNYEFAR